MGAPSVFEDADAPAPRAGGIADRARARHGEIRYLDALNPEQREAVEVIDGPVLVLAGAGTGKTRVLTTRIAHTIAVGRAKPWEILAVTFTNKAAREMKERVALLAGPVAEGMPWLGTFHAISTKILRRHAELVGLKSGFTILDTDDQIRLMKQVIQAENIDDKRWPARALAHQIDAWKNRGLDPKHVPPGEAMAFANGKGRDCYQHYQERLKILNATDFGDLLLECVRLFRENPDVLQQYQDRFRYMLVDEYQDTNTVQYLWLRLLAQGRAEGRQNVCCVGDDDQSIYGWRGAEVDNILRFEKDFPGAKVIRLERNYRSTGHILATAAHLISKNEGRLGKTLFTDGEDGAKPTVTGIWDSEEEARTIGEEIEQLQRKSHSLEEIAILVRASFQMREFEERFITLGLPYRVIGGPRFYERMEIRDALAYLRCVAQPQDDLAFERIFNTPKRGLGEATLQLLHDHARRQRIPLMTSARMMVETEELKPKQRQTLKALLDDFSRWASLIDQRPQGQLAEMILEESGYTEMWQKDRTAEAAGRLENLKELVRAMEEFPDLAAFLEHISLVMDAADGGGGEKVSVMTLHAAKGLEFETVFLPGWEEGLFPTSARSMNRAGPGSKRSGGSPMSASRGRSDAPRSISPPTGASTACGRRRSRRASSTNCPSATSRCRRPPTATPMAATPNRASPTWTSSPRPMRRRGGSGRSAARTGPARPAAASARRRRDAGRCRSKANSSPSRASARASSRACGSSTKNSATAASAPSTATS